MNRRLDVLVAGPHVDAHCAIVADEIRRRKRSVEFCPMDRVPTFELAWCRATDLLLHTEGRTCEVDSDTTVWWRRPGSVRTPLKDADEQRFVADELAVLWPGVLAATGVRWVDAPWTLVHARLKPYQLVVASLAGADVPATVVTGDPEVASTFAANGPVVAKATSTGVGIAPYVSTVPEEALSLVRACPALLQSLVSAEADVRIVTVRDETFAWLRPRTAEVVDWRSVDPPGEGFQPIVDPTAGVAGRVARDLGLSMSAQDWLITDRGLVFLEANPQGQFLFLRGSESSVVPALADHLLSA